MKQAWTDLKSFVTIAFTFTIIVLVIGAGVIGAIFGNWDIFQIVFTLFSNLITAVFTYFFAKKNNDTTSEEVKKD